MYKKCKTIKTVQRQKEFEMTLLSMMERMPYKDISVSALCREMNVQRKTFYRYFDGIEDVLNAFIDGLLDEAYLYLELKPDIQKFFEYWKGKREVLDILERNDLLIFLSMRTWKKIVGDEKEKLLSSQEIYNISGAFGFLLIFMAWYYNGMHQEIEELVEISHSLYKIDW